MSRRRDLAALGRAVLWPGLGIAAALGLTALAVAYKARQAESQNPPMGRFIDVDGVCLHYVERGQGQPIVLLHGNGTMIQDFDLSGVLDLAADSYRVIAFDRPGFGHTARPRGRIWSPQAQADLLLKACRALGIARPVVVGHSWGTLVALELALRDPAFVRSLVLLSGYYYPTLRLDLPLLAPPAIPVVGDVMRYTISPLLGRIMWRAILRRIFGPAEVPASFEAFPVWMALRPSQLRASAAETAMMVPAAFALKERYRDIRVPAVIVAGAGDRLVSATHHSGHLHEELAGSELKMARGAGHMVHHLVPHEVIAAIDTAARAA